MRLATGLARSVPPSLRAPARRLAVALRLHVPPGARGLDPAAALLWRRLVDLRGDVVIDVRHPSGRRLRLGGPAADVSVMQPILHGGGLWEPEVTSVVTAVLREGDTFLDVGANIGYFSLIGSVSVGDAGRVVAFEPGATARAYCEENLRRNHLANAEVLPLGLWDSSAVRGMYSGREGLGYAHLSPADIPDPAVPAVEVEALDRLVDGGRLTVERCALVKLDIEGAEPRALRGMTAFLRRFRPVVAAEVNVTCLGMFGRTPADVVAPLIGLGYRLTVAPAPAQAPRLQSLARVDALPGVDLRDAPSIDDVVALLSPDDPRVIVEMVALPG